MEQEERWRDDEPVVTATKRARRTLAAGNFFGARSQECPSWSRLIASLHASAAAAAAVEERLDLFQTFARQQPALDALDAVRREVASSHAAGELSAFRVFSFEVDAEGRRNYVATHAPTFLRERYFGIPVARRHCYELIREHAPCRLYFDLEYKREHNAQVDGGALVDEWLRVVARAVHERYDFVMDESTSRVVQLDSSTPRKFSRHVIIHLRQPHSSAPLLFRDNRQAGNFVRSILASVRSSSPQFWPRGEDASPQCFVDDSVYSRNRCFRMLGSSKFGKGVVFTSEKGDDDVESLLASLVVPLDLASSNVADVATLSFDDDAPPSESASREHGSQVPRRVTAARPKGFEASPLPLVDDFIRSVATRGGVQGRIRCWSIIDSPERAWITYQIASNRWCERIGRAHKSNGTYRVVELLPGGAVPGYWQGCHDPDCRGWRSPVALLPIDVARSVWAWAKARAPVPLTAEQRARIEQNRRAAIEKRSRHCYPNRAPAPSTAPDLPTGRPHSYGS